MRYHLCLIVPTDVGVSHRQADASERTYSVHLQQRSFLFEGNQQHRYQNARLGIFPVKENGDYVLVDLVDKDFRPLTP